MDGGIHAANERIHIVNERASMKMIRITTSQMPLPEGVAGGSWMIRITQNGENSVPPMFSVAPESAWPVSLPAGSYVLHGQRLSNTNTPLGPEVQAAFLWDGVGAVTVEVAGSIGVVEV